VKPVPEGRGCVSPYLIVEGAARVIDLLRQAFGATELHRTARPDGAIMHAEVQIGDSVIMLAEANPQFPAMPAMVHVYVPDVDAAYERALRAGATSQRAPENQFYGDRSAGVKDAGGNLWWIATHKEDVPPDELARRAEEAMRQQQ
jgi:uncharacterized glyoxalase superfamily protein PhnB